jgi:hypothetical protein
MSYSNWEKRNQDQKNKTLAYFQKLPQQLQGIFLCSVFSSYCFQCQLMLFSISLFLGAVLNRARHQTTSSVHKDAIISNQTNKDGISHLIHLFKEPGAQVHWTNLNNILNQEQLDARRRAGPQSEAANLLAALAEMLNDYSNFTPQNLMVQYTSSGSGHPVKVSPFHPSSDEWAALANYTHNIDPCNVSRKVVLKDEA